MKINRYLFLVLSLTLALSNCCFFALGIAQMLMDENYINSLDLPSNADSMGIPLAGSIALSLLIGIGHIFFHIVFLIFCLTKLKNRKIDLQDVFLKKKQHFRNSIRIIGYIIAFVFVYVGIQSFSPFYIFSFLFSFVSIIVSLFYVLWIITLMNKEVWNESGDQYEEEV